MRAYRIVGAAMFLCASGLQAQDAKDTSCPAASKYKPGGVYHLSGVDVSQAIYKWHKNQETGRCAASWSL